MESTFFLTAYERKVQLLALVFENIKKKLRKTQALVDWHIIKAVFTRIPLR